jgi:tyrosine-protein kinase Etk/Wzc
MENGRAPVRHVSPLEPEGMTLKQLQGIVLKEWRIFAIFIGIGIALAALYYKATIPYYKISTTLLVKDDSKASELTNIFQGARSVNNRKLILDQIGVLQSYSLNLKTVQHFNWRYAWYKKNFLGKHIDLYNREPFDVIIPNESIQWDGMELQVSAETDSTYRISCYSKRKTGDSVVVVDFDQTLKYGEILKNNFFNFGLSKKPNREVGIGDDYVLFFNNLNKLALNYKDNLDVKSLDENSNIVVVEMKTHQLARDVDYLNKLGPLYIQYGLDDKNRVANSTVRFINKLIEGVNVDLQNAGNDFTDFRSQNKTVDLTQEAASIVEKLKEIDNQQSQLNLRLDYYTSLKYYLDNKDEIKDLVAPTLVGDGDLSLNALTTKLNDLYARREVLSYTVQAKNPTLVLLDNEIAFTQNVLGEKVKSLIDNARLELRNLTAREQRVNVELSRLPKTEQNFIGIKRNYDLNNDLYNFLLQHRAEAEIASASNNPDAQILDPADTEIAVLLGPMRTIDFAVGLAGGIFVALLFLIVREFFSEKLSTIEQVSSLLDLPIASPITFNKFKNEVPVLHYPKSAITESFRGLRINIQNITKHNKSTVVAVHSTISGEGKSFVALNLALIFAINGKRVLLVDGDLRKPRLHHALEANNDIGFVSVLRDVRLAQSAVQNTTTANLSFVPAGPVPPNPSELLNTTELEKTVEAFRQNFDFIIFDNSPIGVVNDANHVGAQADVNLFLLRLNYSKKEQLNSINKIHREGILRNVIVSLNGVKQTKGYGYYIEDEKTDGVRVVMPAVTRVLEKVLK